MWILLFQYTIIRYGKQTERLKSRERRPEVNRLNKGPTFAIENICRENWKTFVLIYRRVVNLFTEHDK